jgi:hypothetical protein
MAKTIGSELTQVEELNETNQVDTLADTEGETVKEITATDLIETAKGLTGDITKFDQTAFDNARTALATLIQVEAGEMAEGSDEVHSIACLLARFMRFLNGMKVKHLKVKWKHYQKLKKKLLKCLQILKK